MVKSMTGFSKAEASDKGTKVTVEVKSLNGRYLDINCKLPKSLYHRELDIRDLVKANLARGSVALSVNIEYDSQEKLFAINEEAAQSTFDSLKSLNKKLKIKEPVTLEHLLTFSQLFNSKQDDVDSEYDWKVVRKAMIEALRNLDRMRQKEGQNIVKDIQERVKKIGHAVEKVEVLSVQRVPDEREKLRHKIAQLFESDEIDETRIQMEIVMIANRLDVSEECVRLKSHIKFFHEILKAKEPVGQKLNFLVQEMNRETNTIGSKSDSAEISQIVVNLKEEIERIREQIQNIE
jgi:uncharacterized protein (TIGR00255 family)